MKCELTHFDTELGFAFFVSIRNTLVSLKEGRAFANTSEDLGERVLTEPVIAKELIPATLHLLLLKFRPPLQLNTSQSFVQSIYLHCRRIYIEIEKNVEL